MDLLEWITTNGPTLGVAVFFIVAWWLERQDRLSLRDDYIRDVRRWANIHRDDDQNGDH